jgi:hypothetical protein
MKTFLEIKARDIVPSSILPLRKHSKEIRESVKSIGVQQPLIVRPSVRFPGKWELIDGRGRYETLDPEEYVVVEERADATDAEVFRISEATQKRSPRSANESALFYDDYVKAVAKETGEQGALTRVSREAQISPSQLSQYIAINELFTTLTTLKPDTRFDKLKSMGINSLYNLSRLTNKRDLLEVALVMEEKADQLTIEAIKEIVDNKLSEVPPELEELLGDHLPAADTAALVDDSIFSTRSKALSEKLSRMVQQLHTILPQVETGALLQAESKSPDTLKTLEKTSLALGRFLYCLRKLKRAQKQAEAKTTDTTCDTQASTAEESV